MDERPIIKPKLNLTDKAFEVAGWLILLAFWTLTIQHYTSMPDTIPIHYNGMGQPDGFGSRDSIFTLPVIATILFIGLTALNQVPHIFNYPTTITPGNALRQYTAATRLIRYLKFVIVMVFGLIVLQTIRTAQGESAGLGVWFLPVTSILFIIPLIFFIIRSFRNR